MTRKVAKRTAAKTAGPGWRSKGVQVYRCSHCDWYHIGRNHFHGKSRSAYGKG